MKKFVSLVLSVVMTASALFCVDLSAYADDIQNAVADLNGALTQSWNDITESITELSASLSYQQEIQPVSMSVTSYESGDYTYTVDVNGNATITSYNGSETNLVVPSSLDGYTVSAIGENAFSNAIELEEVNIPNSVTKIGAKCFMNCTSLKSISIPDGVKEIGSQAFANSGLTELILPNNIETLGYCILKGNTGVTEIKIPKTLVTAQSHSYVGGGPFGTSNIQTATVESGIKTIPDSLFYKCTELENVIIPATVEEIEGLAFGDCTSLKSISIPNSVKEIGSQAFANSGLTELILPNNIETLGYCILKGNTGVTEIKIPKTLVTAQSHSYVGGGPFGTSNIQTATVESGIKTIPDSLFYKCTELENVIIPATVEEIDRLAFAYCTNLKSLSIPNGVTEINALAFSDCSNLSSVIFPDKLSLLASDAFVNCSQNLKLYCNKYSPAMKLAIDNDYDVAILSDEYIDSDTKPIDKSQSEYYVDADSALANGYIKMTVKYSLKTSLYEKYANKKIVVKLSKNTELVENSVQLDGSKISYIYNDNNELSIDVSQQTGTITYCVYPTADQQLKSYATVQYTADDGINYYTLFGVVIENIPMISIESPQRVSTDYVTITGIAPQGQSVSISVNGENALTAKASQSGKYSAKVPLSDLYNYKQYTITATASNSNVQAYDTETSADEISATTKVQYNTSTPVVTEFTMEYTDDWGRQKIDLLDPETPSKTLYYWPKYIPAFLIKFDNAESVDEVYIVSTRNGVKKYLEAQYNAALGGYYATGYFDPANSTTYVPGTISYEYTTKAKTVEVSTDFDFENSVAVQGVNDFVDNVVVEEVYNENGNVNYLYKFDDELGNLANKELNLLMETYSETYSSFVDYKNDYEKVIQYFSKDGEGNEFGINIDFTDPNNIVTFIHDVSNSQTVKTVIEFGDDSYSAIQFVNDLSAVSTITGLLCDNYEIITDDERLREQINTSNMTYEEKQVALQQASDLKTDRINFVALSTLLGLATATIGTGGMAAPALLFTLMLGSITALSSFVYNYRMNAILGDSVKLKWIIDPSGFVYEATPFNRLEGVKCTIYYKETEESTPILWDASEYEQENPLYTNSEGKYAWNVPEGLWQVKYEKEGYKTTYSDWLPVPPPQTEVNIGMVSTESPNVEYVNFYNDYVEIYFDQYMDMNTLTSETISLTNRNGENIPFTIEYTDEVPSALDSDVMLVRRILIIPGANLNINDSYTLAISSSARNYAGLELSGFTQQDIVTDIPEITLSDNDLFLSAGDSETITITVSNISDGIIECSSSNPFVASVDNEIQVVDGKATITIESLEQGYAIVDFQLQNTSISTKLYISCDEAEPTKVVVLDCENIVLNVNSQYTIFPKIYPLSEEQDFLFYSNNNQVASVNSQGIINGISAGNAIITVVSSDGSVSSEINVMIISTGESILVGDVDGDGELTDWDAIVLNRYLAGWEVEIDLAKSDTDGDGELTDWDAIVLERYLAGWDIELK